MMTDDKKAMRDFVASARALARKKNAKPTGGQENQSQKNQSQKNQQLDSQSQDSSPEEDLVCCKGIVHIAYRGIADDRMYMSYSRQWKEIRFFRPHGLRVFCAGCRHRVL